MRRRLLILASLECVGLAWSGLAGIGLAGAEPVKIATWNLDWMTLRAADDAALPLNRPHRGALDLEAFRHYANYLNADIVALQEVDGLPALRALYPDTAYHAVLTSAPVIQNLALVVRSPLEIIGHVDLDAFDRSSVHGGRHLRPALDVSIRSGSTVFRVLVVHLKSGCWARSLRETGHSCPILREQMALVSDWVLQRQDEGVAFLVLGDFNRRLTEHDPYYLGMTDGVPLTLVTSGLASPCEGGTYFIDHILLGGAARHWLIPDTLRVMIRQPGDAAVLSDHCAVSVRLDIP